MCRIAGITSHRLPMEEMQHRVAGMCQSLRHGGPDDEGLYSDGQNRLVFGHRRLSLLDPAATGHQPMQYQEGRFTITYNGEIYNYRELKTELLALGHRFLSGTDTEVVLAAFAAWGTAAFSRFSGMFAFALYDALTAELYLVRDSMGIKPLYYLQEHDTLVFASEVRAFAQATPDLESHPSWPVYLMAYGFLPEPVTTFRKVRPLRKGTFLRYNLASGKTASEMFEHHSFLEKEAERPQVLEEVRQTLAAAVQRHLVADAPLGVFLSGGIDSSILALLANKTKETGLTTLSLHFNEKHYSEEEYQACVLQNLQSEHHQSLLTAADFHLALPEVVQAMDLPSCDGINTWFIARLAASRGLKAVLSGLGGDELFGGYPSFRRISLAEKLQQLPATVLRAGRYHAVQKYRRLAFLSLPGLKGQFLFLRGIFIPSAIARYLDMDEQEVWQVLEEEPGLPDLHHLSPGNRASWMEQNLYMQNQLLRDADVMSMAHGVELRVPFLDTNVVRLAHSIASTEKFSGAYPKQLLIDAFQELLPVKVWQRRKMGFSFPFQEWMGKDEWIKSTLMNGEGAPARLLAAFEAGRLHWSGLMTALMVQTHLHETEPAFPDA